VSTSALASQSAYGRAHLLAGELGRPREALDVLEQAIAGDPKNARLWVLRAWVYQRLREWHLAVEAAKVALHHDPHSAWAFRIMSSGYRHQGWHTQAVSAGREAVKLAPYDPHCFATLGQALSTSPSGWREAGRVIQQALELAPHDPGILSAAGHAALARKRPRLAERYFKQALAIVPDDAAIRNDLAIAHSRTFQIRHAIFGYTEALSTNPNQQLSYTNIAAALYRAALVTYIVVLGCALFAANVNSRIPLILLFVLLAAWEIRGHAWQMIKIAVPIAERRGGALPLLVFGMPIAVGLMLVIPLFPPEKGHGLAELAAALSVYPTLVLVIGFLKAMDRC
jgi:Flp pilus assembly protein TadD